MSKLSYTYNSVQVLGILQIVLSIKSPLPPYGELSINYKKALVYKDDICEAFTCDKNKIKDFKYAGMKTIPEKDGLLISHCGNKLILLSKIKIVSTKAWHFCCGLGMRPAFIESRTELNCVCDAYKNASDIFSSKDNQFSSDYFDQNLNREFMTCPDKVKFIDDLWMPGEPNNQMGMQAYTCLNFASRNKIGVEDINGALKQINAMCQKEIPERKIYIRESEYLEIKEKMQSVLELLKSTHKCKKTEQILT